MSRPSFSRRASPSAPAPELPPQLVEAAPVAVAGPTLASEVIAQADDLAAMFLSRGSVASANEQARTPAMERVEPLAEPASSSPARPPQFGNSRVQSHAQALPDPPPTVLNRAEKSGAADIGSAGDTRDDSRARSNGTKEKSEERALRIDLKSAAVVTDLVSAMAIAPGSDADVATKTKILTSVLILARKSADDLVGMVDPDSADTAWVQAQALAHTAQMIAADWRDGSVDLDELRRAVDARMAVVRSILLDHGGEVESALGVFFEGGRDKPCTDAQSASDHRAVAIHQAAWAIGSAVENVRDARGDVFSFGMPQEEIVGALLQHVVSIVAASRPEVRDATAAVLYVRGAMQRATQLIVSEYVNRAGEACAWVDASETDAVRAQRRGTCPAMFSGKSSPQMVQWAIKNFQSIERASRKLIEDSNNENESADRPGR